MNRRGQPTQMVRGDPIVPSLECSSLRRWSRGDRNSPNRWRRLRAGWRSWSLYKTNVDLEKAIIGGGAEWHRDLISWGERKRIYDRWRYCRNKLQPGVEWSLKSSLQMVDAAGGRIQGEGIIARAVQSFQRCYGFVLDRACSWKNIRGSSCEVQRDERRRRREAITTMNDARSEQVATGAPGKNP